MLVWILVMAILGMRIWLPPWVNIRIIGLGFGPFPPLLGPWVPFWLTPLWLITVAVELGTVKLFEAWCRSFCRHLQFSDGTTADFSGRSRQIIVWWIVWLLANYQWSVSPVVDTSGRLILFALGLWATIQVMRWFINHIELSNGRRFSFRGTLLAYLGWEILLALSVITIVGWAWVLAAQYRWMARNTRADQSALRFHGTGGELLVRTIGAILFSLPIVTVPWAWRWYVRWLVRSTTIEGHFKYLDDHLDVAAA